MTTQTSRTTDGRKRLYDSVVDTIGDTPCIRLNRIAPQHVHLYVKAEYFNPAGSVKDRLAISIIEEAERSGGVVGQLLRRDGLAVGHRAVQPQFIAEEHVGHDGRATHVAYELAHELLKLDFVHPLLPPRAG